MRNPSISSEVLDGIKKEAREMISIYTERGLWRDAEICRRMIDTIDFLDISLCQSEIKCDELEQKLTFAKST